MAGGGRGGTAVGAGGMPQDMTNMGDKRPYYICQARVRSNCPVARITCK